jgi:hypothetical protein
MAVRGTFSHDRDVDTERTAIQGVVLTARWSVQELGGVREGFATSAGSFDVDTVGMEKRPQFQIPGSKTKAHSQA